MTATAAQISAIAAILAECDADEEIGPGITVDLDNPLTIPSAPLAPHVKQCLYDVSGYLVGVVDSGGAHLIQPDTSDELGPSVVVDPDDPSSFPSSSGQYKKQCLVDADGGMIGFVDNNGIHLIGTANDELGPAVVVDAFDQSTLPANSGIYEKQCLINAAGRMVGFVDSSGSHLLHDDDCEITPQDDRFSGSDAERLLQAFQAGHNERRPVDLCSSLYNIDQEIVIDQNNAPPAIRADGACLKATAAMPSVMKLQNPQGAQNLFQMSGRIHIDACCLADIGLEVNGLKWQELSADVKNATSHGVWLHSDAGFGIYYNRFDFISQYNGGDGVRSNNTETNDPAQNFNRIAGNQVRAVSNFNRGNGYYARNTQDTLWLNAEQNQLYGLDLNYTFRVFDWVGGYMENNRRYIYAEPCGEDRTRTDNGPAAARSYLIGANAFRVKKVGGGTIEPFDGTQPADFAEL